MSDAEEAVLLLAESVVASLEAQRGQNDAVVEQMREVVRALQVPPAPAMPMPSPEVRVVVPEQPAPVVNVKVPDRQTVDIATMPRARIVVTKRDVNGRILELEVV